ncbi:DUF317 domain-containing protein [Streptomyces sp. CC208A]|uniref:DUF317 domain-containing protein n=1 Tax=Streptomyces sp. CC208A TaxID=3044573 RepID=UPI0024A85758|nr:DUF317 domain-containing protein [Streptomyces sp. CC208A]
MIDQALVAPRYLAGPGDPAWVTVPLHQASGWSHGHEPLLPRVVLSSPDQQTLLRLEPVPGDQWWRITHNGGSPATSWYASFGSRTPVELIAAVTDALTDPVRTERAMADLLLPLRRRGWQTAPDGDFRSPDGVVEGERLTLSGSASWFITAGRKEDVPVWAVRFDGRTPTRIVAAFIKALADPAPLRRTHEQTLGLSRHRLDLQWQQVPAESLASALPDRVARLAARRHSAPPPATGPAPQTRRRPR